MNRKKNAKWQSNSLNCAFSLNIHVIPICTVVRMLKSIPTKNTKTHLCNRKRIEKENTPKQISANRTNKKSDRKYEKKSFDECCNKNSQAIMLRTYNRTLNQRLTKFFDNNFDDFGQILLSLSVFTFLLAFVNIFVYFSRFVPMKRMFLFHLSSGWRFYCRYCCCCCSVNLCRQYTCMLQSLFIKMKITHSSERQKPKNCNAIF